MSRSLISGFIGAFLVLVCTTAFSQTARTNTTGGSFWFDGGAGWSAGVPTAGSNVTFNNNAQATIKNGENATITSFTGGNGAVLIINNGGSLTISGSFTSNNSMTITVNGSLIISGNLNVNNNIIWNVSGSVTIGGSVNLGNGASMTVTNSGTMNIGGSLTGGNNTALTVNGNVNVGGNLDVGNGSSISGTGHMHVAGSCTDGNSTFCGTGPLPVTLLFFQSLSETNGIQLSWATASELNFDYFSLERSPDGKEFSEIAKVAGHGTTTQRHDYEYKDASPTIGKNYYRLRSIDFDGYTESFKILLNEWTAARSMVVAPNPSNGQTIHVSLNFVLDEPATVMVYDNVGAVRAEAQVQSTDIAIDFVNSLRPGVYYVKFVSPSFKQVERVLVKE